MRIPKKIEIGTLLEVCWLDAFCDNRTWESPVSLDERKITTAGYYVGQSKDWFFMSMSHDISGDLWSTNMYIPKHSIIDMRVYGKEKTRKA